MRVNLEERNFRFRFSFTFVFFGYKVIFSSMKLNSRLQRRRGGFSLIELLATLLILAVIAAILFPFILSYMKKAEHAIGIRSLRTLQDGMDRYRAAKYDFTEWKIGAVTHGNILTNHQQLSVEDVNVILKNISDVASTDRSIRMPTGGLTGEHVVIVSTDAEHDKTSWEVMRYRRSTNVMGVDRRGFDVTNTNSFTTPAPEEIDEAFQ